MTREHIEDKQNEDFMNLLERTRKINNIWEVYDFGKIKLKSNKQISKKIYEQNFLMSAILDSFIHNQSRNLKELLHMVLNEKIPLYFFYNVSIQDIYRVIIEMIKLGYIELYRKEQTMVPIFQLTNLGVKMLQERTLQNVALSSFYNYQSYELNKKTVYLSFIAVFLAILAIIVSILISK